MGRVPHRVLARDFRASLWTPDFEKDPRFRVLWDSKEILLPPQSSSGRAELAPSPAVN